MHGFSSGVEDRLALGAQPLSTFRWGGGGGGAPLYNFILPQCICGKYLFCPYLTFNICWMTLRAPYYLRAPFYIIYFYPTGFFSKLHLCFFLSNISLHTVFALLKKIACCTKNIWRQIFLSCNTQSMKQSSTTS